MRTKYYAYDRWVSLFIVTCETLITGGLFYLLFLFKVCYIQYDEQTIE